MKHVTRWYTILLVIVSMLVGFVLNSEHLPENIKKIMIITSFFVVLGICVNPVESVENGALDKL
jgi:uncharacterized membrane protein YqgA involved in biofilm formation